MKKVYFTLIICLYTVINYAQNLAFTSVITVSSYYGSNVKENTIDNSGTSIWQSNGGGPQYIQYQLNKTIRYANIGLTNYNTYSGYIEFSNDGSTWVRANGLAGNFGNYANSIFSNVYSLTGSQFNEFSYVRINLTGYQQDKVSLGEISIYEVDALVSAFYASTGDNTKPPINALDFNPSTYYQNYQNQFSFAIDLSRQVSALRVNILSDTKGLKIDINGLGGNIVGYDYTQNPVDEFLIINPGGINHISFSYETNATIKLYDIALTEIPLKTISMPFTYDAAGNMTHRTIYYSTTKSSKVNIDSVRNDNNKPYEDVFNGKKILVYPIPTKGLLNIDFNNFSQEDNVTIELFSVSGQKIMQKKTTAGSIDFDLGNRPNGTYFLNIKVNSETHKWTIIKE